MVPTETFFFHKTRIEYTVKGEGTSHSMEIYLWDFVEMILKNTNAYIEDYNVKMSMGLILKNRSMIYSIFCVYNLMTNLQIYVFAIFFLERIENRDLTFAEQATALWLWSAEF